MGKTPKSVNNTISRPKRILLITAGVFFFGLGIVGIFVPILPTTPFFLLAAALFAQSSRRFYNWLINNRFFGKYIRNYREGRGIPVKIKIFVITLLWITIGLSAVFALDILFVRIILLLVAVGVTLHIVSIKTYDPKDNMIKRVKKNQGNK